jgi:hypothetical protein
LARVARACALAFPAHVADSRCGRAPIAKKGLLRFLRKTGEQLRPLSVDDIKGFEAFRQVLARIDSVTFDDMDRDIGCYLVSQPVALIAYTSSTRNTVSTNSSVYFNQDGLTKHAMVRQSTARIATEVMLHFR